MILFSVVYLTFLPPFLSYYDHLARHAPKPDIFIGKGVEYEDMHRSLNFLMLRGTLLRSDKNHQLDDDPVDG